MNKVSTGIVGTKEKLAGTGQSFRFGPETILQLATAATLLVLAAVVFFIVKGAADSLLSADLDLDVVFTAAVNSLLIAAAAMVIALPVSVLSALYITELAPSRPAKMLWAALRLLSAVPSVVLGFIAWVWLVYHQSPQGTSPARISLIASFVLALIVYPSLTSFLVEQLMRIPASLKASSYALGASRWQTIAYAVYPAARSGFAAAGFFGLGRVMGDTAIVLVLWQTAAKGGLLESQGHRLFAMPTAIAMAAETGQYYSELFLMALLLMALSIGFSSLSRRFMRSHWGVQE